MRTPAARGHWCVASRCPLDMVDVLDGLIYLQAASPSFAELAVTRAKQVTLTT